MCLSIKRGVLQVLIIAILIIPVCVSMAFNPAGVTEVWVDLSYDDSEKGWGETRFDSIQTAVNTVDPGTTINVNAVKQGTVLCFTLKRGNFNAAVLKQRTVPCFIPCFTAPCGRILVRQGCKFLCR